MYGSETYAALEQQIGSQVNVPMHHHEDLTKEAENSVDLVNEIAELGDVLPY